MDDDVNFNSSFPTISYHIYKISTLEDGEIGHLCAYKRFDRHHSLHYIRAPNVYHVNYDVEWFFRSNVGKKFHAVRIVLSGMGLVIIAS